MSYLTLSFPGKQTTPTKNNNDNFKFRNKPFANSDVLLATVKNYRLLTHGSDVKRVYNLELSVPDVPYEFLPGDSIAILPCNNEEEVEKLLVRLNIEAFADEKYQLEINKDTTKKNTNIPKHLPPEGTLRDVFSKNIDIRSPPKKLFLKALLQHINDPLERVNLEHICSPKGSKEYAELINHHRTLLNVLNVFPSCIPPVKIILEHSLPLQPRYYSISSSPLVENTLNITFFLVENHDGSKGVCTGWLENVLDKKQTTKIPFYFRKPTSFRLSKFTNHVLMIGAGTGIAPFMSFLQHLDLLKSKGDCEIPQNIWLLYGCRYHDKDYLFKDEINHFVKNGTLSRINVSFSRENEHKRYVQNEILDNGEAFVDFVLNKHAVVYVCGNFNTVVKDVKETILNCFGKYAGIEKPDAEELLKNLITTERYIVDTWV